MDRRELFKRFLGAAATAVAAPLAGACQKSAPIADGPTARIAFVKTGDRSKGVARAIDLLGVPRFKKGSILLKPNFNSAAETPGSTHNDTLRAIVAKLRELEAGTITVGDRSGMGSTADVFESKGINALAKDLDLSTLVFDELGADAWELIQPREGHWKKGFYVPKALRSAGAVVQTCCLKTHRFGGHFTLALKNSVGIAAKRVPGIDHNFMTELHSSRDQRRMIAEINTAYTPALIVLDGVDAFTTGGPDTGKEVNANIILAGTDPIAVDAVGVALLRYFGTTDEVKGGGIFGLAQIARAVELGLGVDSGKRIELVTGDAESAKFAREITDLVRS
jgi:uncharacterized protein (DUF362 family)